MHANCWFDYITGAELLSLAAAVFCMAWKRQLGRWPSLFASLSLELTTDITCLMVMRHYRIYFFVYWISAAIQAFIRLWVICDIVRSFPGIDFIPRRVYLFVAVAGLTMAAASAHYCFYATSSITRGWIDTVVLVNRCVNIAFATFVVAFLGSVKLLNLGWDACGARISNGFFIRSTMAIVVGEIYGINSVQLRTFANCLESFCTIAVFLFWGYLFTREPACTEASIPKDAEALNGTPTPC